MGNNCCNFQKYIALQEEQHVLKTQYSEAQKTLEEVGATLSENKLQLAELLEKEAQTSTADETPTWTDDKDAVACTACAKDFTIARRKVSSFSFVNFTFSLSLFSSRTATLKRCKYIHHSSGTLGEGSADTVRYWTR